MNAQSTDTYGGAAPRLELQLPRDETAPAQARAAVAAWCDPLGVEGARVQALVLLVSELVSNAVIHSTAAPQSQITLEARIQDEILRVVVTDAGEGFTPRPRDPARISDGYGLFLLDKIASTWGVDAGAATNVWFELPTGAKG